MLTLQWRDFILAFSSAICDNAAMNKNAKIFIAGHQGLVGSAILRHLRAKGANNIIVCTRSQVDLTCQAQVEQFFACEKPQYVFLAAAKVGGILANNTYPADFIYQNLAIQTNVIHCAHRWQATKLLFLGSSCIYPKFAAQPLQESSLLTGALEPTNEAYAVAKIAGIKMCQAYHRQYGDNFIAAMPTNLYGPNDNFDLETSHVLPALLRKFHEAKEQGHDKVELWGSGTPRREFLHVDDLADACVFLMENYQGDEIINVGVGEDISIGDLANLVRDIVGFRGSILWDKTKPDGTPRKLLDTSRLQQLGWRPKIELQRGIEETYQWFCENVKC